MKAEEALIVWRSKWNPADEPTVTRLKQRLDETSEQFKGRVDNVWRIIQTLTGESGVV